MGFSPTSPSSVSVRTCQISSAQYIRGAIRECDLIDRLPATVKLRYHTAGIDGQQFSHFAKCFHFVGVKVSPQAQTGDHQLPELLRRHIAIGMRGDQLMQTFAGGSLLQAAVQVIQVAGQHPDRLRQHPDTGKTAVSRMALWLLICFPV
ncbi:hypothetical protein ECZU51_42380 [Escherichia coli]|nr:hypothetical protein ECZU51_42380 [Escherichia coli]